jgi:DNA repair exonuclease SbcCD ATPase subunit
MPEPGELIAVITATSALIGSLSAGAVQWGLRAAARRKAMAEAAGVEAGVSSSLFAEWRKIVEELRTEVSRLVADRLDMERQLKEERVARAELGRRLEEGEARERLLEDQLRQARRDIETLKATVRTLKNKPQPGD